MSNDTDVTCKLGGRPCRHCSEESNVSVQRVGVLKSGTLERRVVVVPLDQRCNNHGRSMVSELESCPMDSLVQPAPGAVYIVDELSWSKRRGGA